MNFDALPWVERAQGELRGWGADLLAAGQFLTRLPLARFASGETGLLARSMRAFPVVGIGIGLLAWVAFALAILLGLPVTIAALLAVLAGIALTGALHEDGLADTADGFGGGADAARKLAIMRDSRTGAYGALALVFSVALRAGALAVMPVVGLPLTAAHAVSRAALPVLMRHLDPARSDGLGAGAGQPDDIAVLWCLGLAIAVSLLCLGVLRGLVALAVTAAALALFAALARRQVGGYTGDVLGAAQQVGEILMLLCAAIP